MGSSKDPKLPPSSSVGLLLSPNALEVLRRRYLARDPLGQVVETPEEMFARVAQTLAAVDLAYDPRLSKEEREACYYRLMASLEFLPNSPTLMNAGTALGQLAACFVIPVGDSMREIFEAVSAMALIHQSGGGTGFSFSRLRPAGDKVRGTGGVASGPVSFMRIFDTATEVIKQGGRRRGANMGILRVDHPDILAFIRAKGEAGILTNFNLSVSVTDAFMQAVEGGREYPLVNPRTGKEAGRLPAAKVWEEIARMAWQGGDPGVLFLDAINRANPTPHLGAIEATNPCFTGQVRLATDYGLLTFEELHLERTPISVLTDRRALGIRSAVSVGATAAARSPAGGVTLRKAVPVFLTRKDWPVYRLETEHGFEITATADHAFFTLDGLRMLKEMRPGDTLFIQSGAGLWNQDDRLPCFDAVNKLAARVRRMQARIPDRWSRDLGKLLGWVIGDGWVSAETPRGRNVPNYTVGLMFGDEEKRLLAPAFQALILDWLGMKGAVVERNGSLTLYYKSSLYYFLRSLGLDESDGLNKEIPRSIWWAPREAVLGFLSALFTADGTVNVSAQNASCSVRLANSSKKLLQQVQLMLLNEGIVAKLYFRRRRGTKWMPDSQRQPKMYSCSDQYELVMDGESRDRFLKEIGFLTPSKQNKALEWLATKRRRSNRETFTDRVRLVAPAGTADVYCTTEPETHSVIANGFVTAQCGEQPLLPWEACNLGSVNLARMVREGRVDWEKLRETVHLGVQFLDNVIDANLYPLSQIEAVTKANRKIGLGVMGFADLLLQLGIPYDSEEALRAGEEVMAFIRREAHARSVALALERGSFPNFARSRWKEKGYTALRNATVTTVAPTGTIALLAGTSSGIEPLFGLAYTRRILEGTEFLEVNPYFREALDREGLSRDAVLRAVACRGTIRGVEGIPDRLHRLFVTAFDIAPIWHLKMQAAFQRHTDNAVSKTVNLPEQAAPEDVRDIYRQAYLLGCKGVTVFRYGSRPEQVLYLGELPRLTVEPEGVKVDAEYSGECRICSV